MRYPTDRTTARLAAAALGLVLVIITAAAFLRMGHAGLGCPDWPACYGMLDDNAARLEQTLPGVLVRLVHRVTALATGALVLALAWQALQRRPRRRGELAVVSVLLLLLVFLAVIGRWTGVSRVPAIAAGNILGGSALAALLWLLWRMQSPPPPGAPRPALAVLAWLALAAFALQATLGALVSAKHAALACGGWFSCPGADATHGWSAFDPFPAFVPGAAGPELATLQLAHHYGAAATLALALPLGALLLGASGLRLLGLALLACVAAQAALGTATVYLGHPLGVSIAHNVMANLLLLALVSAVHAHARGPAGPRA